MLLGLKLKNEEKYARQVAQGLNSKQIQEYIADVKKNGDSAGIFVSKQLDEDKCRGDLYLSVTPGGHHLTVNFDKYGQHAKPNPNDSEDDFVSESSNLSSDYSDNDAEFADASFHGGDKREDSAKDGLGQQRPKGRKLTNNTSA